MSTIIKKQYETAKQLLKTVEFCCRYYEKCGKTQKDFDYFYNNATSLLTIFGHVHVGISVIQGERASGTSIIDDCRQRFAAYEAELMHAGLISSKWEQILADVEPTEPAVQIEYTEEQEAQMWYEHQKQIDYDPQF
jgi:hypothetical protein